MKRFILFYFEDCHFVPKYSFPFFVVNKTLILGSGMAMCLVPGDESSLVTNCDHPVPHFPLQLEVTCEPNLAKKT